MSVSHRSDQGEDCFALQQFLIVLSGDLKLDVHQLAWFKGLIASIDTYGRSQF